MSDPQGPILKFLMPILITIIGTITIMYLSDITKKFEKIDIKFDIFLSTYHAMDKRVNRLEYKVFKKDYDEPMNGNDYGP